MRMMSDAALESMRSQALKARLRMAEERSESLADYATSLKVAAVSGMVNVDEPERLSEEQLADALGRAEAVLDALKEERIRRLANTLSLIPSAQQ